jgi:hypothetical protein
LSGALAVSGQGLSSDALVLSIDSPTQLTLTENAQSTGSSELTFSIEPVTLAEAKKQLRLEIPDDDSFVAGLITAARMAVENQTRRALITQDRTLFLDGFAFSGGYYNYQVRQNYMTTGEWFPGLMPQNAGLIKIPWPPLQVVQSIQYWDMSNTLVTIPPEVYLVSPGNPARVQPGYTQIWPLTRPTIDAVQILYTCGYGMADKVPAPAKSAIKLIISDLYENRGTVGEKQVYVIPNTVCALLDPLNTGVYW